MKVLILVRETTEFGREFHNEMPLTLKNFFLISREVLTCANLNWWPLLMENGIPMKKWPRLREVMP